MSNIDNKFKDLILEIKTKGKEYEDKHRDCIRKEIPFYTFNCPVDFGFQSITLKELYWKSVVGELIWFLSVKTNTKFLTDNGIKIWNNDAPNGECGKVYGYQWRNFNGEIDQLKNLINGMVDNIMSSELIVTAMNPSDRKDMVLACCHNYFQVVGQPLENGFFGFWLHFNMRSVDTFLGLPFNIASYNLLALILERLTGYKFLGLRPILNKVHIYDNQYNVVDEILKRDPNKYNNKSSVDFKLKGSLKDYTLDEIINDMKISDFKLVGYESYPPLRVKMLPRKR